MKRLWTLLGFAVMLSGCSTSGIPSPSLLGMPAAARSSPAAAVGSDAVKKKRDPAFLYAADRYGNDIVVYRAYSKNSKPLVHLEIQQDISSPSALALDAKGDLYVANGGSVTGYNHGASSPFVTYSNGIQSAVGLAVGSDGTLYVANGGNPGVVLVFPPNSSSPSTTITDPSFYNVDAVALDQNNNLYIAYSSFSSAFTAGVAEVAAGSTTVRKLAISESASYSDSITFDSKGNMIFAYTNPSVGTFINVYAPNSSSASRSIGPLLYYIGQVAINASDSRLFVGMPSATINVLDYESGSLVNTFTGPPGSFLTGVAVSRRETR